MSYLVQFPNHNQPKALITITIQLSIESLSNSSAYLLRCCHTIHTFIATESWKSIYSAYLLHQDFKGYTCISLEFLEEETGTHDRMFLIPCQACILGLESGILARDKVFRIRKNGEAIHHFFYALKTLSQSRIQIFQQLWSLSSRKPYPDKNSDRLL